MSRSQWSFTINSLKNATARFILQFYANSSSFLIVFIPSSVIYSKCVRAPNVRISSQKIFMKTDECQKRILLTCVWAVSGVRLGLSVIMQLHARRIQAPATVLVSSILTSQSCHFFFWTLPFCQAILSQSPLANAPNWILTKVLVTVMSRQTSTIIARNSYPNLQAALWCAQNGRDICIAERAAKGRKNALHSLSLQHFHEEWAPWKFTGLLLWILISPFLRWPNWIKFDGFYGNFDVTKKFWSWNWRTLGYPQTLKVQNEPPIWAIRSVENLCNDFHVAPLPVASQSSPSPPVVAMTGGVWEYLWTRTGWSTEEACKKLTSVDSGLCRNLLLYIRME